MEVHKIELMIIDFDEVGAEEIKDIIQNTKYPNRCISPAVMSTQTRDVGVWGDDHPLNDIGRQKGEYDRLFNAG